MGCANNPKEESVTQYKIEGNISDFSEGTKFYLHSLEMDINVDSALVKDNKFIMQGHISDPPALFWITATDGEDYVYTPLLIGNDNVQIYAAKKDFPYNVRTSGSKIDSNHRIALNFTKELDTKRDSLIFSYHGLAKEEKEKTKFDFLETVGKLDSLRYIKEIAYLKEGHNTYSSLISLYFFKDKIQKDSVKLIFNRFNDSLKSSKYGKFLSAYLESDLLEIGDTYLNIKALDQFQNQVELFNLKEKEKFLLLNYTSAYCGFCIDATKELKFIYKKYKGNLNIVSISADSQKKDWKKSVQRDGNLWPSLWNGKGMLSESAILYNLSSTPTFILISRDGIILDKWVGYHEGKLAVDLKKYLLGEVQKV